MPQDAQERTWTLAQLKPNCAAIAERNLHRQGFAVFLPLEEATRRKNGRFVTVRQPLFPGYVFVGHDAASGRWRAINATQGIARLVRFGDAPAEVPIELISDLRARIGEDGTTPELDPFTKGDRVRLATGPFAGFLAEIAEVAPDRRVWLLIDLLGARTRMQVAPEHLRRT